jgi:hypothetical protein
LFPYSSRNVANGSVRDARRAGTKAGKHRHISQQQYCQRHGRWIGGLQAIEQSSSSLARSQR